MRREGGERLRSGECDGRLKYVFVEKSDTEKS